MSRSDGSILVLGRTADECARARRALAAVARVDTRTDAVAALAALTEERRDLVKKYSDFLNAQFEAHKTLAKRFTPGEDFPLNPEQLKTLRSLGYIQ